MSPIHRPLIVKLALSKNYYYRSLISIGYIHSSLSLPILIYVHLNTNVAYICIYIYIYIHITEQFLQSNDPACKSYTTTRASVLQSYPTHLCMSKSDLQFRGEEEGHRSCISLAGLYVSTIAGQGWM